MNKCVDVVFRDNIEWMGFVAMPREKITNNQWEMTRAWKEVYSLDRYKDQRDCIDHAKQWLPRALRQVRIGENRMYIAKSDWSKYQIRDDMIVEEMYSFNLRVSSFSNRVETNYRHQFR